ncbi:alanine racemase [Streptococcus ovuberis]|uniref:Alanine racemase n=1 Tax=Streptococcus ovuberis TaxID=1936207 RepID=A0A7X6S0M9_9STRE|nr:alanine racemase [Streptococcus ovuberis]NKZ19937.1 alanine racemase [Streptococcus ovuberis]
MISSEHRPTSIQVNLGAIQHNVEQITSRLPKKTKVWAVVKANAYGHGAVAVARSLVNQVYGFCLSNLDEALELRQAGIDLPLLVLGVVPKEHLLLAHEYKIQVTVASLAWLKEAVALGYDLSGLAVHVKLDTGMGRIGFREPSEVNEAIALMQEQGMLFEGLFTHFATADEADDAYLEQQLSQFQNLLKDVVEHPEMIHTSNSAATLWHQETICSAVRLGNAIYGLNPSGRVLDLPYKLKPALSLTTELVHVKQVEAGCSVGYGATYQTLDAEWIGTIPIGYADGLTRDMQGFSFLVDGHPCEIIGRVSMDQVTLRLPGPYPLGTKVTLIGQEQDSVISVQDWADYRGTINYEIVCLLSDRIPRHYC